MNFIRLFIAFNLFILSLSFNNCGLINCKGINYYSRHKLLSSVDGGEEYIDNKDNLTNNDTEDGVEWGNTEGGEGEKWNKGDRLWSSYTPTGDVRVEEDDSGGDILDPVDVGMSADFFLDQLASISVEEIQAIEEDAEISASVLAYEEANVPASLIEEITGKGMEGGTLELDGDVDVDVMGVLAGEEGGELEEVDFENVDSHTIVPKDEDGNPIRSQAVYVDEHTCVGCTLCSTVATSTFFMEQEMGRARVFQQWGDDDETVAIGEH